MIEERTVYDARATSAGLSCNAAVPSLKIEGGWSSVTLVERYAHLLPKGHEAVINRFLRQQADTITAEISTSA